MERLRTPPPILAGEADDFGEVTRGSGVEGSAGGHALAEQLQHRQRCEQSGAAGRVERQFERARAADAQDTGAQRPNVGRHGGFLFEAFGRVQHQEVVSEISEIMVAKATKLPDGPSPAKQDDNCSSDFLDPTTEAGRYVRQRGWGVLSEVSIGDYQLVSFAGEFVPGTSGSCAVRQGNIGVFEGSRLEAILYTARKSDELIGALVPREAGRVRLWSGDYLGYPVADITVGSIGLIVGTVADEDVFCQGTAKVPNVYDLPITEARTKLQAAGWDLEFQQAAISQCLSP